MAMIKRLKVHKHEFCHLQSDPCMYIHKGDDDFLIVTVWVDNLMLFASLAKLIQQMKADLQSEWEMTDLGEPAKIVGIEITRADGKYVENILRQERMADANHVAMPMDPNVKLKPNLDGNEGNQSNSFAKLLGELQFLANATCPDIAYTINRLEAYTANPSLQDATALKRILRYLKGTKDYGITYHKSLNHQQVPNSFYGFADAAYPNTDNLKSTSGYVFLSAGGAIMWR